MAKKKKREKKRKIYKKLKNSCVCMYIIYIPKVINMQSSYISSVSKYFCTVHALNFKAKVKMLIIGDLTFRTCEYIYTVEG